MTARWHLRDRRGNLRKEHWQVGETGETTGFNSHRGDRAITHEGIDTAAIPLAVKITVG